MKRGTAPVELQTLIRPGMREKPCRRIREDGSVQIFAKGVSDGQALAVLNRGAKAADVRLEAGEIGFAKSALWFDK